MVTPFTFYGEINVDSIVKKLEGLDWDLYQFRQKTFGVHSGTKTVPLLWNEKPNHENITIHPEYQKFENDLFSIQALLPPGNVHTAILINLPAGRTIPMHVDAAPHFKLYKRIHVPIVTNPKCFFTVGLETIHMKPGEMWEIDNDNQRHGVSNCGDQDRVHLLIDYFVL